MTKSRIYEFLYDCGSIFFSASHYATSSCSIDLAFGLVMVIVHAVNFLVDFIAYKNNYIYLIFRA